MQNATSIDIIIFLVSITTFVLSALWGQKTLPARMFSIIAVLLGATLLVSAMLQIIPGDPIENILGDQAPQYARDELAIDLGLKNKNGEEVGFISQYAHFIGGTTAAMAYTLLPESQNSWLKNNFPPELKSYRSQKPVRQLILPRLAYTARLAFLAMLFAIIIGPLLGILAAWKQGGLLDAFAMFFAILFIAIPRFWLGPLLILVFSLNLGLLPVSGVDAGLSSYLLPAFCLGSAFSAVLARFSRASMLEVLSQDYIRTARAKGLSERVVLFKHALRNAMTPILTILGLQFGAVLAGAVITEKVFVFPGLGLLLLESIQRLDLPVVQACVLLIAFFYVFANWMTDMMYKFADPRLKGVKHD